MKAYEPRFVYLNNYGITDDINSLFKCHYSHILVNTIHIVLTVLSRV